MATSLILIGMHITLIALGPDDEQCLLVGPSLHDPIIENVIDLGVPVDYRDGKWFMGNEQVGKADFEDNGFELCSNQSAIIQMLTTERTAIVNAGGFNPEGN